MSSLTRDRSCAYYLPWIATACLAFGAAALAIWIVWTKKCHDHTVDALDALNLGARHLNRFQYGLLGTSIGYMVVFVLMYLLSFWRSFIEAAHDATGTTSGSSMAFMVIAALLTTAWFFMILWLGVLLMANGIWSASLYVLLNAVKQSIADIARWGTGTWLPSQNLPCPGQCLDLTSFIFITADFKDACICDPDQLNKAQTAFQTAYDDVPGVLSGNWVMLLAGLCMLINFACQYSHTKRERELLIRVNTRVYSTF